MIFNLILVVVSVLPCTLLGVWVIASSSSNFSDVLLRMGAGVVVVRAVLLLSVELIMLAQDLGSLGDCSCGVYCSCMVGKSVTGYSKFLIRLV